MAQTTQQSFFLVAPNPDGRIRKPIMLSSANSEALQAKAKLHKIDIAEAHIVYGQELAIVPHTSYEIAEPKKRRGRPVGSKNKNKKAADRSASPRSRAEQIDASTPASVRRMRKAKKSRKVKRTKVNHVAVKDTQADRNARLEVAE